MKFDRKFFSISFMLIFILLLFISAYSLYGVDLTPTMPLNIYDFNSFALFYLVPTIVWVCSICFGVMLIALLKVDYFRSKQYSYYIFPLIIILLLFLYGIPHLVEQNPRFVDSWVHGRSANKVVEYGELNLNEAFYQSYPSSFLFMSLFSLVTSFDIVVLLSYMPVFFIILYFSVAYMLFNNLLKDKYQSYMALLFFGVATISLNFHFSPEIYGTILFFILMNFLVGEEHNDLKIGYLNFVYLFVLFAFGITTSHHVTQFIVMIIWGTYYVITRDDKTRIQLLIIFILFVTWNLINNLSYTYSIFESFIAAFYTILNDMFSSIVAQPISESTPADIYLLSLFKRAFYVVIPILGAAGGFFYYRDKKPLVRVFFSILVSSVVSVPLTIFGILPLERPIRLAFIPLTMLSAYFVSRYKRIGSLILVIFVLTIPLNFASMYWNEPFKMYYDWEVESGQFIADNFDGVLTGDFSSTSVLNYYGDFDAIYNDYYLVGYRPDIYNYTHIVDNDVELIYLHQIIMLKEEWRGRSENYEFLLGSDSFNRVYSSYYSNVLVPAGDLE